MRHLAVLLVLCPLYATCSVTHARCLECVYYGFLPDSSGNPPIVIAEAELIHVEGFVTEAWRDQRGEFLHYRLAETNVPGIYEAKYTITAWDERYNWVDPPRWNLGWYTVVSRSVELATMKYEVSLDGVDWLLAGEFQKEGYSPNGIGGFVPGGHMGGGIDYWIANFPRLYELGFDKELYTRVTMTTESPNPNSVKLSDFKSRVTWPVIVPEPSTWLLACLTLGVVALTRKRSMARA